jgi:hypothetical protein
VGSGRDGGETLMCDSKHGQESWSQIEST